MATKEIGLKINLTAGQAAAEVDKLTESTKTLKQQVKEAEREAQMLAQKFGDSSKEAVEAQKKLARLKDELGDFKNRVDALNPEAKLKAFGQVAQGVAGGFAAAQGAMALFGAESEDVQKALMKVQAALALTQGIEGLMGLADNFKTLKVVAVDAMNGIKAAIASNPIFTLVAVITAVAAAFATWGQEIDKETEKIKANGEASKKVFDELEKSLDREIRLKRAAGEETTELERRKLAAVLLRVQKELEAEQQLLARKKELAKAAADEEVNAFDILSGNIFNKVATTETAKKVLKEKTNDEIQKKEEALLEAQNALKEFDLSQTKKTNDEKLKNYNEYLAKKKAADEEAWQEELRLRKVAAEQSEKQITEDLKSWTENEQKKLDATHDTLAMLPVPVQQFTEESLSALEIFNANLKQSADDIAEALNGSFGQAQELALGTLSTNLNTANTFMDAAMNRQLSRVKGNEAEQEKIRKVYFERQKKLQIAQATISTYEAAVNAFKTTYNSPITAFFPAAPYIAAASAIAQGLAQVAAIRSTSFEGGGGGGASTGGATPTNFGGGGVQAPNVNDNSQNTLLNREQIENNGSQTISQNNMRVYVVESDIREKTDRIDSIKNKAKIV